MLKHYEAYRMTCMGFGDENERLQRSSRFAVGPGGCGPSPQGSGDSAEGEADKTRCPEGHVGGLAPCLHQGALGGTCGPAGPRHHLLELLQPPFQQVPLVAVGAGAERGAHTLTFPALPKVPRFHTRQISEENVGPQNRRLIKGPRFLRCAVLSNQTGP